MNNFKIDMECPIKFYESLIEAQYLMNVQKPEYFFDLINEKIENEEIVCIYGKIYQLFEKEVNITTRILISSNRNELKEITIRFSLDENLKIEEYSILKGKKIYKCENTSFLDSL